MLKLLNAFKAALKNGTKEEITDAAKRLWAFHEQYDSIIFLFGEQDRDIIEYAGEWMKSIAEQEWLETTSAPLPIDGSLEQQALLVQLINYGGVMPARRH